MKRTHGFKMLMVAAVLMIAVPVCAQIQFTIEAELPESSIASFTTSQVFVTDDGQGGQDLDFQPYGSNTLDFGEMKLNGNGIFAPSPVPYYFVIDVGSDGAGMPDVTLVYTDTNNPNGGNNDGTGLGNHATINFAEIVTNPDLSQDTNDIATVALADIPTLNGGTIDDQQYIGGFLRMSVGIATGSDVANADPFTALDKFGTYSGDLTITTVFDND